MAAPLLAGALVAATAVIHVSWWQEQHVAPFDAAVSAARDAADASAVAFAALGEARVAAEPVASEARAVLEKGTGFLGATEIAELTEATSDLDDARAVELPSIAGRPSLDLPDIANLDETTVALTTWGAGELDRAESVVALSEELVSATDAVTAALVAVAGTAGGSASAELAAAPLAAADARAAVEAARDAIAAAATSHDGLSEAVAGYAGAVTALRSSQQQAQAAADAAANASSGPSDEERMLQMLHMMWDEFGIDPDTCVQIDPLTWACA